MSQTDRCFVLLAFCLCFAKFVSFVEEEHTFDSCNGHAKSKGRADSKPGESYKKEWLYFIGVGG